MSRPTLILISIIILLGWSCKKDCDDEPSGSTEPCPCTGDACIDQLMSLTYFEEGSWWVYEEMASGLRDSVYVYEAFSGETSGGARYFTMRAHSELEDYNYYHRYYETVNTWSITRPYCDVQTADRVKTKPGDFVGASPVFFVPLVEGDFRYWGAGTFSIDSLWLNSDDSLSRVYYDVDECDSEHYEHAGFHLEPSVGIVRKTLFDRDEIWQLVDHHTIQ